MKPNKAIPFSLAAMAAAMFLACDQSPSAPKASTSPEARADLQAMAAKVKYFSPQDPAGGMGGGDLAKRGAGRTGRRHLGGALGKTGAAGEPGAECEIEATQYFTWEPDSTSGGDLTVQYDTTTSYTAAGQPICAFDDETAYEITRSRSENAMLETHITTRTDIPPGFLSGEFKMTGNGTVRYKDGYLITIASMNIVIDMGQGALKTYVMNLELEKGYTVVLQPAPGMDMMGEGEPDPNAAAVSGPIRKDGLIVGYFEVLGDDRVIIRDADKVVIESHG